MAGQKCVLEEVEVAAGGELDVGDAAAVHGNIVVIPEIDVRLIFGDDLLNLREDFFSLRFVCGDAGLFE